MKKLALVIVLVTASAFAQGPLGFAALPTNWVDPTVCNPPGGVYDTTVLLGTTNNIGPNVAGGPIGSPYPLTYLGLLDAMNNWRDNADAAGGAAHFADKWWLIKVPAGTVLHGSTFDNNNALISIPAKVNGTTEPSKCLVVDSTTPLPLTRMVCSHGMPGVGGVRLPGCPNDQPSMWTVQVDGPGTPAAIGRIGIFMGINPNGDPPFCPAQGCWVNHVLLNDFEVRPLAGSAQSKTGVKAYRLLKVQGNPLSIAQPTSFIQAVDHIGLTRYYVHGYDPGDPGQPAGTCSAWTNTSGNGVINVAPDGGNPGTSLVTLVPPTLPTKYTGSFFGMTFQPGSIIVINGTNQTIANTLYTQTAIGTATPLQNLQISITGSVTLSGTSFTQSNPPPQYANGCGDDIQKGMDINCDFCWMLGGYVEKIHWYANESQAVAYGFSNGPFKVSNNCFEGGSESFFSGGGPIDTQGGPLADLEARRNCITKDLAWRQLSATAGNSPEPPFGCGTVDGKSGDNTCPFNWAIKNDNESKLGHRALFSGNRIYGSWADAQAGFCQLINARTCSGGSSCGIYNNVTGLPNTVIDNIRYENNWISDCPQPIQMSNRSGNIGNGGGTSAPVANNDFINNLMSNIADQNQFGSPGHEWEWTSGQDQYPCVMSYTGNGVPNGSSPPFVATAACAPEQLDITGHITAITENSSDVVTVVDGNRMDPILSTSPTGTCITNGQPFSTCPIIITNHPGWNGVFALTGTVGNWASDGTGGGNQVTYTDNINALGTATLCTGSGTGSCANVLNSGDVTYASLGFKMTDIAVGDDVYASNIGGGDTTCVTNGYAVGALTAVKAITGTIQTGLTVVYPLSTQPTASTANCLINNGAGFPKATTVQNNTVFCVNVCDLQAEQQFWQPINNFFFNNVWADNDSGHTSDHTCAPIGGGEGTPSFVCWDNTTFEFYHNVLTGRNSANWSVINCPGGSCSNAFPPNGAGGTVGGSNGGVNCPTTPNANCMGYVGFTGASPLVIYPSVSCSISNAPVNCPLMAPPWASNFTLSDIAYAAGSSYSSQGVNLTQLTTAMTQNQYVCPVGASCGGGPQPDYPGGSGPIVTPTGLTGKALF